MTQQNYFEIFTHNVTEIKKSWERGEINKNQRDELLRINSQQYEAELAKRVKK